MRFRYVVLIVFGLALAARAAVDALEAFSNARHEIGGAMKGINDCQKIYSAVQLEDHVFHKKLIALCEERANLGSRYVLIESAKAWVSGMWFCNNIHCSEYIFPIMDQIGMASRYLLFVAMAGVLLGFYYGIPFVLGLLFDRLRPQPHKICSNYAIDMNPHAMYAFMPPQPKHLALERK